MSSARLASLPVHRSPARWALLMVLLLHPFNTITMMMLMTPLHPNHRSYAFLVATAVNVQAAHGDRKYDYANDNGIPQIIGTTKTYKVKSGDTLSKIAVDNKTSVSEIKRLNNLTSDTIKINQVLIVN
jgi:hypothetical protein